MSKKEILTKWKTKGTDYARCTYFLPRCKELRTLYIGKIRNKWARFKSETLSDNFILRIWNDNSENSKLYNMGLDCFIYLTWDFYGFLLFFSFELSARFRILSRFTCPILLHCSPAENKQVTTEARQHISTSFWLVLPFRLHPHFHHASRMNRSYVMTSRLDFLTLSFNGRKATQTEKLFLSFQYKTRYWWWWCGVTCCVKRRWPVVS